MRRKTRLGITLDPDLVRGLEDFAQQHGLSRSSAVNRALLTFLSLSARPEQCLQGKKPCGLDESVLPLLERPGERCLGLVVDKDVSDETGRRN
jgi:hypothetical protein